MAEARPCASVLVTFEAAPPCAARPFDPCARGFQRWRMGSVMRHDRGRADFLITAAAGTPHSPKSVSCGGVTNQWPPANEPLNPRGGQRASERAQSGTRASAARSARRIAAARTQLRRHVRACICPTPPIPRAPHPACCAAPCCCTPRVGGWPPQPARGDWPATCPSPPGRSEAVVASPKIASVRHARPST